MKAWWLLAALLVLVISAASALLRLSLPDPSVTAPAWHEGVRLAHRVSASAAGLVLLLGMLFGWSRWAPAERVAGAGLLVLTAGLALLGRYTPSPQPAVAWANLMGGHALLALVAWLLAAPAAPGRNRAPLRRGALLAALVLLEDGLGAVLGAQAMPGLRSLVVPLHQGLGVVVLAGAALAARLAWTQAPLAALLSLIVTLAALATGWLLPAAYTAAVAHSVLGALSLAATVALWQRWRSGGGAHARSPAALGSKA